MFTDFNILASDKKFWGRGQRVFMYFLNKSHLAFVNGLLLNIGDPWPLSPPRGQNPRQDENVTKGKPANFMTMSSRNFLLWGL